ncbi:MAG: C45 family autoproteolytic acyltransferase/hydrolase [Nocardioidaceae bacterium]
MPRRTCCNSRAELHQHDYATADGPAECTTFAVLPIAAADGTPLVGQNADLPALYSQLGVVIHVVPDDGPAVLMLTPAGQVSYIGINDRGLGVFGNFLSCDGWRVGFPRYLLTRPALLHDTVRGAVAAVRNVPRASSRNLIMLDANNDRR